MRRVQGGKSIMPALRLLFLAILLTAGFCRPLLADENKPVIEIRTRSIEASVTIDSRLKTYAPLYARLLADSKSKTAKWSADADKMRKETPEWFTQDRRWTYERDYEVSAIVGAYVSIVRNDDTYSGGAHPNHVLDTLLWDDKGKRFINIGALFTEVKEGGPTLRTLAKAIRTAVVAEKKARGLEIGDSENNPELKSIKPKLTALGGIALAPSTEKSKSSGFGVYFSPYAVGSYAEGPYVVFVPWSTFKDYLSPAGKAVFAGDRPEND
jgi:hypothetical protein